MEIIDLTSLENAINSLKSILIRYKKESDTDIRDAVIQRFEYTYSLSIKVMSRFLNLQSNEGGNTLTFNEIIRKSNQYGLLKSNLEIWNEYREKRNLTSHTYDENIANQVVSVIPTFKDEAEFLLNKLKEKLK